MLNNLGGQTARYNHLNTWDLTSMSIGLSALRVLPPARLGLAAVSLAVLAACSSTPAPDRTEAWSPNKIYAEAKDEAKSGAWDKAIPLFEKLEGRAAGTPLAQQAQLEKAFAHYKANEPAQALATIDRFKKLHPASPGMDYALYLQGLINFNDSLGIFGFISKQDLSERDQNAAKESFEAFKELATRFPDSRYTPDARARMTYIVNSLAQYEVHVARYYYSRSAYVAAINRAQNAVTDYQNVPAAEEALYIMVLSYDALGMNQLRDDTKRVMEKNYPQSEYLARGFKAKDSPWWKMW
jgi:outer membrane protein assembly factor BamD